MHQGALCAFMPAKTTSECGLFGDYCWRERFQAPRSCGRVQFHSVGALHFAALFAAKQTPHLLGNLHTPTPLIEHSHFDTERSICPNSA